MSTANLPPRAPKVKGYVHTRTFFQYNRWSAHDLIGELLANGITQISIFRDDADWVVSWVSPFPPDVIKAAIATDPS